jgi:hypothetical protein
MKPVLATLTLAVAATLSAACSSAPAGERDPSAGIEPVEPAIQPELGTSGGRIFTDDQAERGRASFRAICSECHFSSEFRGTQFQFEWRRRTVWDFYREISRTMPEDAPGSLEPQQYVDIISYVLRANGFSAGDRELTADQAVLDSHSMASPTPDDR